MYGLIMAGGSGTRLWPKSRINNPKQLQALISKKSMIIDIVERIKPLIKKHHLWVATSNNYVHKIREQIPSIPTENILAEPFPLGTGLGVALGLMCIYQMDKDAIVAVLWSDNIIKKTKNFINALKLAEKAAKEKSGVIIGVNPTFPATGYGYIEMGDELEKFGQMKIFKLHKFIEKPDIKKAKEYLTNWRYLWNSGISVWKADKFLKLFKKYMPKHHEALIRVKKYINQDDFQKHAIKYFTGLKPEPIDFGVYEKAKNLATIPADLGWSDIGNWGTLSNVLRKQGKGYLIRGHHIGIDSKNCFILGGKRLVTTLGVNDLIIIDTDDAILITHKDHSEKVKELTQKIEKKGFRKYL